MLQNAYFLAKIGADTAENERNFTEILPKIGNYPTGAADPLAVLRLPRRPCRRADGPQDRQVVGARPNLDVTLCDANSSGGLDAGWRASSPRNIHRSLLELQEVPDTNRKSACPAQMSCTNVHRCVATYCSDELEVAIDSSRLS